MLKVILKKNYALGRPPKLAIWLLYYQTLLISRIHFFLINPQITKNKNKNNWNDKNFSSCIARLC